MKILFLTYYFEPDLCAGSFRNTSLFKELLNQLTDNDFVHVITTQPHRYKSFQAEGKEIETGTNFRIDRINLYIKVVSVSRLNLFMCFIEKRWNL